MVNVYPLLISHIAILFPMFICSITIKKFKNPQAILLLFQLIFNLIFSVMYHVYDYGDINFNDKVGYDSWSILDHNSSSITIICTALYISIYSDNMFFILSYLIYNFMLINRLIPKNPVSHYMVIVFASLCTLFQVKNIINYFKNFFLLSITTLFLTFFSTFCFYYALENKYELWHSVWHLSIFTTSGLCYLLRYKYEKKIEHNLEL